MFLGQFLFAIEIKENNINDAIVQVQSFIGRVYGSCLMELGILPRGVISCGDIYIDNELLLGKALVRAYEIESYEVIFPRILLDCEAFNFNKSTFENGLDYCYFIDKVDSRICLNALKFV